MSSPPTNFRDMIFEILRKTGMSSKQLALHIEVAESTFNTWKNGRIEPRYSQGKRLVDLYEKECKKGEIPR